ncbi:MAG: CoA transferase [Gammaproteobacteria bacterium]|nr:CoA transferase [Gammaproteobacteria bacterium]MBT5601754.1 CoA transferase [Gammaproteobacteria bacterium]
MSEPSEPYTGIRVIEFGQFVAVPFCGQLLAEGGADVIKVESPAGDPNRHMGSIAPMESTIFISRNRGKRSLPLKLSDPGAGKVIDALVASADVVLMNFRPGLAEDLGLDPVQLGEKYPRLIIGEITPFGKRGPDADLAGMDIVVQARSGLMASMGRLIEGRPAPGDPVISDYMAAMSLAFGIGSALYRRERTGKGGIVDVSLMQSAMTLANNQLIRHEDRDRESHLAANELLRQQRKDGASFQAQMEALPSVREFVLLAVYFRTFETADNTIAVAAVSPGLQVRFMEALGLTDRGLQEKVDQVYIDELKAEVEATLRAASSEVWCRRLQQAGVPVSMVKFPLELFEDAQAEANNMFDIVEHATAGRLRVLSPPVKLDTDGFKTRSPTAPFGSETRLLLAELGMDESAIDDLLAAGISRELD